MNHGFWAKKPRERSHALQPKEDVAKPKKRAIFLRDERGGRYPWTLDEIIRLKTHPKTAFLLEKKRSRQKRVPSIEDVKDSLLKLIVFNNISELRDPWVEVLDQRVCLGLTSDLGTAVCWNTWVLSCSGGRDDYVYPVGDSADEYYGHN